METEQNQFEQVRKLLALKKHEQPPPRYFQEFSGKVIARLHALEAQPVTWRRRLGLDFNLKPALIGVFGVAACGLLLVGVISSLGVTPPSSPSFGLLPDPSAFGAPTMNPSSYAGGPSLDSVVNPNEIPASTVPVGGNASDSPFGLLAPRAERASFKFGSGN
jgi:hypothetical protein